jgi:hypothetical protein
MRRDNNSQSRTEAGCRQRPGVAVGKYRPAGFDKPGAISADTPGGFGFFPVYLEGFGDERFFDERGGLLSRGDPVEAFQGGE